MPQENRESNRHEVVVLLVTYHREIVAFLRAFSTVVRGEIFVCTVFLSTRVPPYFSCNLPSPTITLLHLKMGVKLGLKVLI